MKDKVFTFCIFILVIVIILGSFIAIHNDMQKDIKSYNQTLVLDTIAPSKDIIIKHSIEDPKDNLLRVLIDLDVMFPEIVYSQAILETGNFTSSVYHNYNNLFGLYNSSIKDYYYFATWQESVVAYKKYIQYKIKKDEDYYIFLDRIGYAEDPSYISKVKHIVKLLNNK